MVKYSMFRIESGYFLHDKELYLTQRSFPIVHDMHLYTLQMFAFTYRIERFKMYRAEDDSGQL